MDVLLELIDKVNAVQPRAENKRLTHEHINEHDHDEPNSLHAHGCSNGVARNEEYPQQHDSEDVDGSEANLVEVDVNMANDEGIHATRAEEDHVVSQRQVKAD